MNNVQRAALTVITSFLLLAAPGLHGQSLNSFNLSYQYNPSGPLQLQHRLVATGTGFTVYFRLQMPTYDSIANYSFSTFFRQSYADSSVYNETTHDWRTITDVGTYPVLTGQLNFVASEQQNIIVIHVKRPSTQKSFFFDIPLRGEHIFAPDRIIPQKVGGKPVLTSYFSHRDSLILTTPPGTATTIYGFYYQMDFEEARPPMVIDTTSAGRAMAIDSTFTISTGRANLARPGLYLFQTDSTSGSALSLRLTPFYYPRFVSVEEVIAPLRYISSKDEYGKLVSSRTKKKALDNFLLDISGSQDRARRIMQNYFDRVKDANLMFTGFKEGWKTDAGMIYIVFGHPDVVERTDQGEVWSYLNMEDKSDLKFEFVRVKNIFDPGYLSLIRKNDYDRYWFRFVDLWRKGRI